MSDSIDRVFIKAISTVKTMSSSKTLSGSLTRPPSESRIKLYGLYKQATEGDVVNIVKEVPPGGGGGGDEKASREKWQGWRDCHGLSKTEAKRQYISLLISTMRLYASRTTEAKELLGELEFMWDQVKDVPGSSDDEEQHQSSSSVIAAQTTSRLPPPPPPPRAGVENDAGWKQDIMVILQNMQRELEDLARRQQQQQQQQDQSYLFTLPKESPILAEKKSSVMVAKEEHDTCSPPNGTPMLTRLVINIIKTTWIVIKHSLKDAAVLTIILFILRHSNNSNNTNGKNSLDMVEAWILSALKRFPWRVRVETI